jgi:hypothetical protein
MSSQKLLGTECAQVIAGSVEITKLRRVTNPAQIDSPFSKLIAIKAGMVRGAEHCAPKARPAHRVNHRSRQRAKQTDGSLGVRA